eukprot:CAMPEP_0171638482 /NCGR_PEP_ID=MMETSP0990-20121206/28979_1 /TAXON_ID=483369 /ORGANISM="non described non described, Strain CCMP2098" /LENGTH=101 /DNA_ID=CAMNT_0012211707 /DNA_START=184 /DNA_END=489 /DNA_ORIENTATION=+
MASLPSSVIPNACGRPFTTEVFKPASRARASPCSGPQKSLSVYIKWQREAKVPQEAARALLVTSAAGGDGDVSDGDDDDGGDDRDRSTDGVSFPTKSNGVA